MSVIIVLILVFIGVQAVNYLTQNSAPTVKKFCKPSHKWAYQEDNSLVCTECGFKAGT